MDVLDGQVGVAVLLQIAAGIGLAAATGLRAFLPALVVGLLARLDVLPLRESLDWMQSTPALVILGAAVVMEILADKIPWVDHALDGVGLVVKPAAGALVLATVVTDLPPLATGVVALAVGGTLAGTVHVARAGARLTSTGTTGGLANPVLSVAEDGLSLTAALVAVFAPLLVLALLIVAAVLALGWFRRRRHRRLAAPRASRPVAAHPPSTHSTSRN